MSQNVLPQLDEQAPIEIPDRVENPAASENSDSSDNEREKAAGLFPIPLAWNLLIALLCCVAVVRLAPQWIDTTFRTADAPLNQSPVFVVDVNLASLEELQALPEVGIALAERIVDYRQTHGNFRSIDELQNVHGFGPKRLENLRELLTVNGGEASASNPSTTLTPIDGKLNAN